MNTTTPSSCRFVGLALAALFAAAGCSSEEEHIAVHPVAGHVSYQGKPTNGAIVTFIFASDNLRGQRLPTPQAVVDENGDFQLGCFEKEDGAPAGEYRIAIVWPEEGGRPRGEDEEAPDRLHGRYAQSAHSGLTATITEGDNQLPPFELQ